MPACSQLAARNAASSGCTNGPTFANAIPNFMGGPPEGTRYTPGVGRESEAIPPSAQRFEIGPEEQAVGIPPVAHAPPVAPVRVERRELGAGAVVHLAPVRTA